MAIAVTAKVQIHFCALGQPELQIAFWKLDGSVFDGQVVAVQTDLWKRLHVPYSRPCSPGHQPRGFWSATPRRAGEIDGAGEDFNSGLLVPEFSGNWLSCWFALLSARRCYLVFLVPRPRVFLDTELW